MHNPGAAKEEQKTLPKIQGNVEDQSIMLHHFDALYGWRPNDEEIFYLNTWESLMWWRVVPKASYRSRRSNECPRKFVLEYPRDAMDFYEKYLLVRRTRPVVPAPTNTPMPDRVPQYPESPGRQHEERCRLYSVYMRPWTSNERFQTDHVPLLQNLHQGRPSRALRLRGKQQKRIGTYAASWQWYVNGNVVSQHQARIITSFMQLNAG